MTPRLEASPLTLLRRAAGSPAELASKARRLARALGASRTPGLVEARLARLTALGLVPRPPTRVQLFVGSVDMLRFWISPAAAEYYAARGIHYGFHQLLRVLDDPASMIDATGLLSERDTIIGHLMQVVHANPAYDLQLLASHEGGLEALERQLEAMLEGTHPRAASIGAIVEEADYHRRLLAYVRAFRADPGAEAPRRDNVAAEPHWRALERTFGTLSGAMAYFAVLPAAPLGAAWHLLTVRRLPEALAAEALAARVR